MNKEFPENKIADTQDIEKEETPENIDNNYQRYVELGGIINEKDYRSALDRMKKAPVSDEANPRVVQVRGMASNAKIALNEKEIVLYVILRGDVRPEGVKYHHSGMSDQRIFMEVLRMLGDAESVDKMIKAYPNISFKY